MRVGAPPKTIIDDGERHVVVLTIWDANAETKVYWRSPDGNARTTIIPGKGIQSFQTAGEFKLEAVGEPNRRLNTDTCCVALGNKNTLLPLFPQKRTWFRTIVMSALCHYATFATSFDHFVGAREQHRRHGEGERLGGLEINDQLEFGRLFNR
jgi:hypothetical protein